MALYPWLYLMGAEADELEAGANGSRPMCHVVVAANNELTLTVTWPLTYDGSKLHWRQAVGLSVFNTALSQPVFSLHTISNFARARFRDSTRRAQKSHFGRRRLEILSHSLGNGPQSKEEDTSRKSGIVLEHAPREFSRLPEYMHSSRTEEAPETSSSPSISEHGIEPSKVVKMLDSESRK
jgi:hypothetical protein